MPSRNATAARLALGAGVVLAFACGPSSLPPRGQLLVYLNTDAPLPPAPGDVLGPNDPHPLFNRVRFDIYRPGETTPCNGCSRQFDVDRSIVGAGKASIGIVPNPGVSGYRARVRLFTSAWNVSGEPSPATTLDTTVALSPVQADGIMEVTVVLHTDDAGRPIGQDAPVPVDPGPPHEGLVGTWPGVARVDCRKPAGQGEVCIPGGAYWMQRTSLAVVSPFFLTPHEVTVGEFRAANVASDTDPTPGRGSCAFTPQPDLYEDIPVNCLSWSKAREYCLKMGGDLPSEAQWEYAAGGFVNHEYVWGDDPPRCDDASYGYTYYGNGGEVHSGACHVIGGLQPAGGGARDRVVPPGGSVPVVDLAGSLGEWVLDPWNEGEGGCWQAQVYHDPVCTVPTADPVMLGARTFRGGSIADGSGALSARTRRPWSPTVASIPGDGSDKSFIGFRCARAAL